MERLYSGILKFDYSIIGTLKEARLVLLRMTFQHEGQVSNWSVKEL